MMPQRQVGDVRASLCHQYRSPLEVQRTASGPEPSVTLFLAGAVVRFKIADCVLNPSEHMLDKRP